MIKNKQLIEKNITFTPHLKVDDPLAEYWLHQVTLRLRREISWHRFERGITTENQEKYLPYFIDQESEILIKSKFSEVKKDFFKTNPTA